MTLQETSGRPNPEGSRKLCKPGKGYMPSPNLTFVRKLPTQHGTAHNLESERKGLLESQSPRYRPDLSAKPSPLEGELQRACRTSQQKCLALGAQSSEVSSCVPPGAPFKKRRLGSGCAECRYILCSSKKSRVALCRLHDIASKHTS